MSNKYIFADETFVLKAIDDPSLPHFPLRNIKQSSKGSGCVAQLVEQSLPIPEVRGSNPVISKNLFILNICLLSTVY